MKNNWILAVILVFPFRLLAAPPVEEGKSIFLSRCAACHNVNKQMTGPALAGVHERRSIDWIISFVNSSQSMIKKGDKDAVALFVKFNKVPMPDHPDLSADHIRSIVDYIKAESKPVIPAGMNKPPVKKTGFMPLTLQQHWPFFATYLGVVFILVVVLVYAVRVNSIRNERAKNSV
jgi:mono/diheme cytochrome c family protein